MFGKTFRKDKTIQFIFYIFLILRIQVNDILYVVLQFNGEYIFYLTHKTSSINKFLIYFITIQRYLEAICLPKKLMLSLSTVAG